MAKNDGVVRIHGKAYKTVARRVADFRAIYKIGEGWGIVSEMVDGHGKDFAVFRAQIVDPQGRIVATGWGRDGRTDSPRHKVSWVEIAETSAIGRALSFVSAELMGDELQIASADEVVMAIESQGQQKPRPQNYPSQADDEREEDALPATALMESLQQAPSVEELMARAKVISEQSLPQQDKVRLKKVFDRRMKELRNG
tara:strand:+ start:391 stop:987 length:597 start_codon:yes stop_codon:yes gene_type:complete